MLRLSLSLLMLFLPLVTPFPIFSWLNLLRLTRLHPKTPELPPLHTEPQASPPLPSTHIRAWHRAGTQQRGLRCHGPHSPQAFVSGSRANLWGGASRGLREKNQSALWMEPTEENLSSHHRVQLSSQESKASFQALETGAES